MVILGILCYHWLGRRVGTLKDQVRAGRAVLAEAWGSPGLSRGSALVPGWGWTGLARPRSASPHLILPGLVYKHIGGPQVGTGSRGRGTRALGAEAASVSVLGGLCGPGAVPAHGDGLHLHAAGHASGGAGVEVRPQGQVPALTSWAPGLPLRKGSWHPHLCGGGEGHPGGSQASENQDLTPDWGHKSLPMTALL